MAIKDLTLRIGRGREPVRRWELDPFRNFQLEMNRLFDDFFGELPVTLRSVERVPLAAVFSPRVNVSETDNEVTVSAELPGMDEKDLTVEMDDAAISIRGEKKEEKEEKGKNWYTREHAYGSFHRDIPLPANVEADKAKARFKKGILTITVPKTKEEQAKRKAIKIETE